MLAGGLFGPLRFLSSLQAAIWLQEPVLQREGISHVVSCCSDTGKKNYRHHARSTVSTLNGLQTGEPAKKPSVRASSRSHVQAQAGSPQCWRSRPVSLAQTSCAPSVNPQQESISTPGFGFVNPGHGWTSLRNPGFSQIADPLLPHGPPRINP